MVHADDEKSNPGWLPLGPLLHLVALRRLGEGAIIGLDDFE